MINWMVFTAFVFSMAMTILGLLVDLTYQVQFAPQIENIRKEHSSNLPNYLQQQKEFRLHPIFRNRPPQKKDLAQLIAELRQGDLQRPLIEESVKKSIYALGANWMNQKHKLPKLDNVELLFAKIREYDHWNLPFDPDNDLASELIVADQIFLAWTFYFQPLAIREALEKSRVLSEILLTTQDLNYKRAGLAILQKEGELVEYMNSRSRSSKFLWSPVSKKQLKTYRYHLRHTADYLSPLTDQKIFKRLFFDSQLPLGFCSIFKKKFKMLKWSQKFLKPRFPLEPDFTISVTNIEGVQKLAETECVNWATPETPPASWIRWIPYYRRIYGAKMIINAERKLKFL